MLNWIGVKEKIKPQRERVLICYCPEWSEIGYQVAKWNGKEFYYDEQPNNDFNGLVEKWSIFYEAD